MDYETHHESSVQRKYLHGLLTEYALKHQLHDMHAKDMLSTYLSQTQIHFVTDL